MAKIVLEERTEKKSIFEEKQTNNQQETKIKNKARMRLFFDVTDEDLTAIDKILINNLTNSPHKRITRTSIIKHLVKLGLKHIKDNDYNLTE
jgi:transcription termination factor NusB